ncbi:SRPBCC family protein [Amnibacterium soli]|uniref:SRPBCC family protein n=1 Tax=Amnibacterium soli TaxID=1282736 RepID=A0ABP8Z9T6_9MICO
MASTQVRVVIHASRSEVYDVARDLSALPAWAGGLASGAIEPLSDDALVVDSPMGRVTVVFAPRNEVGVLDHDVTLPSGDTVHNPMRVHAHPHGAEVVFTLQQGDASDEDLARDAALVQDDLHRLKALVEG